MSSVLITGSEGCIGPYLVSALRKAQPDAHVIRLRRTGERVAGEHESVAVGDLANGAFLDELFEREEIRFVVHAAGTRYSAAAFQQKPFDLFRNDLGTLIALLERSSKLERFVFLSSATVYERVSTTPMGEELTESFPPAISPYGAAKYAAERMIGYFSKESGVPATVWRLFNVVSPRESPRSDSGHVFIDFFRQLYLERVPVLRIKGNGAQTRCFTWVEDVAAAIMQALRDPRSDNETFNLGHDHAHSMIELAEKLVEVGHRKGYLPADYQPKIETGGVFFGVDSQNRVPDVRKAREVLGLECPTSFGSTFEMFVDEMMKHEH